MSTKCGIFWFTVAVMVATFISCGGERNDSSHEEQVQLLTDSLPADTLTQEEEEELSICEESTQAIDGIFNDFLFAYLHNRSLRRERTACPLLLEHPGRQAEMLEQFDPEFEFGFLFGEYFTTLYGNVQQMQAEDDNELEEDSIVSLQRINLNDGTIRNFQFLREKGRWKLTAIREATFQDDDLNDFLCFYANFCTDSLFQAQTIANPLRIVLQDPEDDEGYIDGTIDADQWQSFCPEVPSGIISNIRKGQNYGGHRIVLRKSGLSNGLQEVFTFTKEKGNWRLTRYEN